jgi:hypothetical protein
LIQSCRWHKIRAIANSDFDAYKLAIAQPHARINKRPSFIQQSIRETMETELGGIAEKSLIDAAQAPSAFFNEESNYMRGWDLFMLAMIVFTSLFTVFEIAVSSLNQQ